MHYYKDKKWDSNPGLFRFNACAWFLWYNWCSTYLFKTIFRLYPVHLASGISTSYRTSSSSKPAKSNFTFHFNFTRDQRHLLSELPQTVEYSLFSKFSVMNKFLWVDLKVKWWFASRSWGHYQVQQMHLKILFSSLLISN